MVICPDDAAHRLHNVLWNDPAPGVMRQADHDIAPKNCNLQLPGILSNCPHSSWRKYPRGVRGADSPPALPHSATSPARNRAALAR